MNRRTYRAALYCRISRDDGDRQESDSIVTQRHMLEDFCARDPELTVAERYVDDGFTGTNFRRPDFRRMLADIDDGRIDCVIVKDLSRFGRDYIDVGYYLERYFPQKGVRFIAVNDSVDSARGAYDMMLPLKNVFNAMYARDVSDKVRRSLRTKQRRGECVGAFPPYGYQKDPENRNRLRIDPDAAATVREIFAMKADGKAIREIARTLNRNGVPSPIEYKRGKGVRLSVRQRCGGPCSWSGSAVKRILTDEVYLGCMVSNRYPSDEMHGKQRAAPQSEWIVVRGAHEPVVTKALWEQAHRNMASPRTRCDRPNPPRTSLFRGLLRCGDCGRALVRRGKQYCCGANKAYGDSVCGRHAVSENFLTRVVLADLNLAIDRAGDIAGLAVKNGIFRENASEQNRRRTDTARAKLSRQKQACYEDYRAGRITREAYLAQKEACDRQEAGLSEKQKREDAHSEERRGGKTPWAAKLIELGKLDRLDRESVEQTVREIRVFEDKHIEIRYLFAPVSENTNQSEEHRTILWYLV